jgi:twinkle protein
MASIDEIKGRASITEVIGDYVKLKKKGSEMVALCPFHTEKTPSFTVSPAKSMYKCFGCGKSGDVFAFVMDHERKSFIEAVKLVAARYNMELDHANKTYTKPPARLTKLSDLFLNHFESVRKISNNTLLRFGVTEGHEWMPGPNAEVPVVCFNYYRDGDLINIKFRGPNKSFKLAKDAELIFYNLDAIKGCNEVVIVEGEIDALSCHEAGIHNVVSVPNGAGTGNQSLPYLDNCYQYFQNIDRIILMTDGDGPGLNLRDELARRLGRDRCWRVEYPEGCKDANEVLVNLGPDHLASMVAAATQWPIEGILTMDEMYDEVVNYYENGYPAGTKMGISGFDDLISFMPGQYTTVTGIPGSGKSEFVDLIMTSSAKLHQWGWGICSFENQPSSLHVTKLMEKIAGKSFAFRHDANHRLSIADFEYSVLTVDRYFHFINISQVDVTLKGILAKAKELVLRKGIKGLLIDPWNYIEHKIPPGYTETQYISESLTELKTFALQTGIHIILVAHPTKLKKESSGKYEVPTMYSISGSAHFFNKTDNGITIYRDFETNQVDVYIQKIRYSWLGKIGFCSFQYNLNTRQYIAETGHQTAPEGYWGSRTPYNDAID